VSTVIIIGGDKARAAINQLETESIAWTEERRAAAEAMLAQFTTDAAELCSGGC